MRSHTCNGAFVLFGRGELTLQGLFVNDHNVPAITGGTGEFRGARGEAHFNNDTSTVVFEFTTA